MVGCSWLPGSQRRGKQGGRLEGQTVDRMMRLKAAPVAVAAGPSVGRGGRQRGQGRCCARSSWLVGGCSLSGGPLTFAAVSCRATVSSARC